MHNVIRQHRIPSWLSNTVAAAGLLIGRAVLVIFAALCYVLGYSVGVGLRFTLWCMAAFLAGFRVARQ